MTPERGVSFLTDRILRFTPPLAFNDPFEFRPTIRDRDSRTSRNRRRQILEDNNATFSIASILLRALNEGFGVLSLSEDPTNLLLWSHYAENHRGVAIEFDATDVFFSAGKTELGYANILGKIRYRRQRPVVTPSLLRKLDYRILNPSLDRWVPLLEQKHPVFFVKSLDWKYEKEWRLIRQLSPLTGLQLRNTDTVRMSGFYGTYPSCDTTVSDTELVEVPARAVRAVIVGAMARQEDAMGSYSLEEILWRVALTDPSLAHIRIKRAVIDSHDYRLKIVDTSNLSEIRRFLGEAEFQAYKAGFSGREVVEADLRAGRPARLPVARVLR